jgi:hypothetical protein
MNARWRRDCPQERLDEDVLDMVGFGVLPNSDSRRLVSDPLPPSAALPLTEGENKAASGVAD